MSPMKPPGLGHSILVSWVELRLSGTWNTGHKTQGHRGTGHLSRDLFWKHSRPKAAPHPEASPAPSKPAATTGLSDGACVSLSFAALVCLSEEIPPVPQLSLPGRSPQCINQRPGNPQSQVQNPSGLPVSQTPTRTVLPLR